MIDLDAPDHKRPCPVGWPADLPYPADRHAVRAAIYRRGATLRSLSLAVGISESSARVALHCRRSPAGEQAISEFLGVTREDLFDRDFWSRSRKGAAPASEPSHMKEPAA